MPPKMASNSELSEIKLLLQSLASGLKAVRSDVAELKKNQAQSHQSGSTCTKCQGTGPNLSSVEKALSDTETKLLTKIRDTESAVLQLVEEEKVLIHAEVVQLSRTVGTALEDAKGKMMEKVDGVADANDRKKDRFATGIDDDDASKKRMKEEDTDDDTSDVDDPVESGDWWEQRYRSSTAFDRAVMDIERQANDALGCQKVPVEWLLMALLKFQQSANDWRIERWNIFQKEAPLDIDYCLYGIFYHGHEHEGVGRGLCCCRERVPGSLRQRATRCILVKRSKEDSGELRFSWGPDIGPAPVLGKYE
ncbi:hypothetical protein B0T20DRAFT_54360 [Sordaria brevicollis]|uniref:Uncharacterized protein n=1 Tax=Sordaria brevicollis TaxID=83679 RepID=A0AAE0P355_SORBR|nr:hypothetical protein B0T20DRAFT_54360 [Sordaria brevicollis]